MYIIIKLKPLSMKIKFLTVFALCILIYISLSSRSGGAGTVANLEVCGTPGTTSTCNNCHTGGTYNPTTTVTIKNSAGNAVTSVNADSVYDVSVVISAASGTPAGYGFQAIFLSDSANQNAGTFQNLGANQTQKTFTNGRKAVEQSSRTTSNTYNFKWKAPTNCPGATATIYVFGLATNGNNNDNGDRGDAVTLQVTHIPAALPSAIDEISSSLDFKLFPNPVVNNINITSNTELAGQYQLAVFAANGQQVLSQIFQAVSGNNNISFNVENLPVGIYRLVLLDEKGSKSSKSFLKF